jgi:hypothetical protein
MNHGVEIFDHEDRRKHHFWNTAPADPLQEARDAGRAHYSRVTRGVLHHQSFFPVGKLHRLKTMERVPATYLLWVMEQAWSRKSKEWAPVIDYVDRHREMIEERATKEGQACKSPRASE